MVIKKRSKVSDYFLREEMKDVFLSYLEKRKRFRRKKLHNVLNSLRKRFSILLLFFFLVYRFGNAWKKEKRQFYISFLNDDTLVDEIIIIADRLI